MSILVKSGRVVTSADDYIADVYVEDGVVSAVGTSLKAEADTVIDASGMLVLPGGVDPHTHMETPFGGSVTCDDFTSGTISAVFGGTTTIIDFCMQQRGQTLTEALNTWHEHLRTKQPVCDVGFHVAVTDLSYSGALDDLETLTKKGVTSFKFFMAYKDSIMVSDEVLFKAMQVLAGSDALAMVHAENGDVIDVLVKQALAEGRTEPKWHAVTRPAAVEGEATNRAVQLAHLAQCRLYIVHVSCREAIAAIGSAREHDWQIWGETCPQYLLLDGSRLEDTHFEGAKYVYTPPSRTVDDQEALWRAIGSDVLSVVSTDHCPFNWSGQKSLGMEDFSKIPNGGPGVEHRLELLHHYGVRRGRISLNRMVELVSTTPAKLFDLYPRKGTIAPGSDADIVVFNPERRHVITAASHHSRVDYNLYEGTEVGGAPEVVLVHGEIAVSDGRLNVAPGHGRFLYRMRNNAGHSESGG